LCKSIQRCFYFLSFEKHTDVSTSFNNAEDKFFIENPLDFTSSFFKTVEGEKYCFSSTHLFHSFDHEDANKIIGLSDHRCCDLFTPIFDKDVDYVIFDLSKELVYDDLSVVEVKIP